MTKIQKYKLNGSSESAGVWNGYCIFIRRHVAEDTMVNKNGMTIRDYLARHTLSNDLLKQWNATLTGPRDGTDPFALLLKSSLPHSARKVNRADAGLTAADYLANPVPARVPAGQVPQGDPRHRCPVIRHTLPTIHLRCRVRALFYRLPHPLKIETIDRRRCLIGLAGTTAFMLTRVRKRPLKNAFRKPRKNTICPRD